MIQFILQNSRFDRAHRVEPRYNEPLHNEVLGITNDFLYPSNNKIYEKEPRYNEGPRDWQYVFAIRGSFSYI